MYFLIVDEQTADGRWQRVWKGLWNGACSPRKAPWRYAQDFGAHKILPPRLCRNWWQDNRGEYQVVNSFTACLTAPKRMLLGYSWAHEEHHGLLRKKAPWKTCKNEHPKWAKMPVDKWVIGKSCSLWTLYVHIVVVHNTVTIVWCNYAWFRFCHGNVRTSSITISSFSWIVLDI